MKRISKIIICVLSITLILCSCVAPCFAQNWSEIAPKAEYNFRDENLPHGMDTAKDLFEIAEKAYKIGLFGGQYPVAITTSYSSYYNETMIYIYTSGKSQTTNPMKDAPIKEVVTGLLQSSNVTYNQLMPDNTTTVTTMTRWSLANDGSMIPSQTFYSSSVALSTSSTEGQQIVGTWSRSAQTWVTYETNQYSYIEDDFSTMTNAFDHIIENYDRALQSNEGGGANINVSYQLDIPEIITAIPNAAKQIINNAFGFEIFGINIAGLLSVLLIVTIVAFVVKWLMAR